MRATSLLGVELLAERTSFGPRTQKAVLAFQRRHNLAETGEISGETLKRLNANSNDRIFCSTFHYDYHGSCLIRVQEALSKSCGLCLK